MGSFYNFNDSYQLALFIVMACVTIAVFSWIFYFRHWYVGYGMVLSWDKLKKAVVVRSRLMNSPAHDCGVEVGMTARSWGEHSLSSAFAFNYLKRNCRPKKGIEERWVFYGKHGIHPANLTPRLITQRIPVYWDPEKDLLPQAERGYYCSVVGQQHTGKPLKEEGLDDCFFV